jgi:hypothetical protein
VNNLWGPMNNCEGSDEYTYMKSPVNNWEGPNE